MWGELSVDRGWGHRQQFGPHLAGESAGDLAELAVYLQCGQRVGQDHREVLPARLSRAGPDLDQDLQRVKGVVDDPVR